MTLVVCHCLFCLSANSDMFLTSECTQASDQCSASLTLEGILQHCVDNTKQFCKSKTKRKEKAPLRLDILLAHVSRHFVK